jgi:mannose-6-phosphate isomerase
LSGVGTSPPRPITVRPRLDPKPWGGRRLKEWGIALPPGERIGEALLTAPEATVTSGPLAGATLADLARQAPSRWVGRQGLAATGGRAIFPLLIKLIDGQANLSIQVHPDDRAAAAAGLGTGKTEAYYVLAAEPGSVIYLGLEAGASADEFAAACRRADGSAAGFLRQITAAPGMALLIPAGTAHALGAGIALYEIQQPSNVTFRLDDWGRVDDTGQARPLHHTEGLAVLDAGSQPEPVSPLVLRDGAASRQLLIATRYFALERIALAVNDVERLPAVESPQALTCLSGAAMLDATGWVDTLTTGATAIVPAGWPATLTGSAPGIVLRGWVPALDQDVVAPARAAGGTDEAIERLGIGIGGPGQRDA